MYILYPFLRCNWRVVQFCLAAHAGKRTQLFQNGYHVEFGARAMDSAWASFQCLELIYKENVIDIQGIANADTSGTFMWFR